MSPAVRPVLRYCSNRQETPTMTDPVVITHASIAVVALVLLAAVPPAIWTARKVQDLLDAMAESHS